MLFRSNSSEKLASGSAVESNDVAPSGDALSDVALNDAPAKRGVSAWLILLGTIIGLITTLMLRRTNQWDVSGYIVWSLVHGAVYLVAVLLVRKFPSRRHDVLWILVLSLVFRAVAMLSEPALSTDVFRYVWDGRIQAAGVNPYRYVPADPALREFRDSDVYPHINKKEIAHTIYPPMAQLAFLCGASLDMGIAGMKVVGFLSECCIVVALLCWLRTRQLPYAMVLIYAWHPLPIWEFSSQSHIDAVATALMMGAIVAAEKKRQGLAGVALSAAVLVKYFPIAIFPAIWRRWGWRMPLAMVATAIALYLPYVLTASGPTDGFLTKHLDAEGYGQGWGFHPVWLARWVGLGTVSGPVYVAIAAAVLAAIGIWVLVHHTGDKIDPRWVMLLGGSFAFLSSPHYPWYLGFLVPLLVMRCSLPILLMTVLCTTLQVTRSDGGLSWTQPFALTYWLPLIVGCVAAAWPYFGVAMRARLKGSGGNL